MAFIFTCGTHIFQSPLPGYENVTAQCQNCGNFSARCFKRWEWFTFCFVPIIPFSFKPWQEVGCHICNFYQDLKYRPDIQSGHGQQQIPMQGWGSGPGPGSPPPSGPGHYGPAPGPAPGGPNQGPGSPPPGGYYK